MTVRTAILGYGRSGSSLHAGPIEKLDDFELVAACDLDPRRQAEARERFGCAIYDDYHRMLAEQQLDLVVIVTRSDQHCAMTCDCLNGGVNVLVTKPWAVNAAEARRMVNTAKATGKDLLPWLPARWSSDLRTLRRLVNDEEAIGDVFLIRRAVTSFGTRCDWQTETRYGGGYLLNWGPHIVDPPILLKGSPAKSVYGRLKQTINPGDTEDVFLGIITLADHTVVQVEYTVGVESLPDWYIQGTRGTIIVRGGKVNVCKQTPARPDDPTKFTTMSAESAATIELELEPDRYGDEYRIYAEIAQAMRGEKPYPVAPADALQLSRVLDAIRESNATNQVVQL